MKQSKKHHKITGMKAPYLNKGDTIGVFSPSSWVEKSDIELSARYVEAQGLKTFVHPQTYARHKQSAGTHEEKLQAFYDLWDNPDIRCIWAAGGGNRCLHWIDHIDYTKLSQTPKTIIGFSDVTALLNAVYAHCGLQTIHGTNFNRLHKCKQNQIHIDLITGSRIIYPENGCHILRQGRTKSPMVGGNLSVFQYLPQTLLRNFYKDHILFLEDCNEELSRIDRMLLHLRRSEVLNNVSGLIFGQFGPIPETGKPFGFDVEDIIKEHTHGLNIPIIMNARFGHQEDLFPFTIGGYVDFDTTKQAEILCL
ncbi:MAG: LD-carboxypeptidase [Micavibrio sp.]|nr:LD-carboxypeptidase [Micavibrio sp.]